MLLLAASIVDNCQYRNFLTNQIWKLNSTVVRYQIVHHLYKCMRQTWKSSNETVLLLFWLLSIHVRHHSSPIVWKSSFSLLLEFSFRFTLSGEASQFWVHLHFLPEIKSECHVSVRYGIQALAQHGCLHVVGVSVSHAQMIVFLSRHYCNLQYRWKMHADSLICRRRLYNNGDVCWMSLQIAFDPAPLETRSELSSAPSSINLRCTTCPLKPNVQHYLGTPRQQQQCSRDYAEPKANVAVAVAFQTCVSCNWTP